MSESAENVPSVVEMTTSLFHGDETWEQVGVGPFRGHPVHYWHAAALPLEP